MTTIDRLIFLLTLFSALDGGLVGGVFFAFSSFVMPALARIPPPQGISAMQSINIAVISSWFMVVFLGTAVACLLLALSALLRWHQPRAVLLLTGSLLYIVGTVLVTIVFNVPLNDALAAVHPGSADGTRLWAGYLAAWTAWNHVRVIAALAVTASLTLALCRRTP